MVCRADSRDLRGVTVVTVERSGRLCIGRCTNWRNGRLCLTGVAVRVETEEARPEAGRSRRPSPSGGFCCCEELVLRQEDILYWDRLDRCGPLTGRAGSG